MTQRDLTLACMCCLSLARMHQPCFFFALVTPFPSSVASAASNRALPLSTLMEHLLERNIFTHTSSKDHMFVRVVKLLYVPGRLKVGKADVL